MDFADDPQSTVPPPQAPLPAPPLKRPDAPPNFAFLAPPPPNPPRVWTVFTAFGILIVTIIASSAVATMAWPTRVPDPGGAQV